MPRTDSGLLCLASLNELHSDIVCATEAAILSRDSINWDAVKNKHLKRILRARMFGQNYKDSSLPPVRLVWIIITILIRIFTSPLSFFTSFFFFDNLTDSLHSISSALSLLLLAKCSLSQVLHHPLYFRDLPLCIFSSYQTTSRDADFILSPRGSGGHRPSQPSLHHGSGSPLERHAKWHSR